MHCINLEAVPLLRQRIIETLTDGTQINETKLIYPYNASTWWLLGTLGCHLCEDAKKTLNLFLTVQPIDYIELDIADFNTPLMTEFATSIPTLLTATKRLDYPFSVMDLQELLSQMVCNTKSEN